MQKEERMNMFVKCITALFGEILYVDDTACIGPLDITDDNEDNYITDKSKLPSNFTKLGKWIMISGGSWVFNKKEKGSSDIREIPPQVTGADRRHHQPSLI